MKDDLSESTLDALFLKEELTHPERESFHRLRRNPAPSWGSHEQVEFLLAAAIRGLIRSKRAVSKSILMSLRKTYDD